jgi:Cdc6-like AAA superfamily ATPase
MKSENPDSFKPFLFNAMTYPDVKSFSIILYEKIYESYYGELPKKRIERDQVDDEDIACKIEMLLTRISDMHKKTFTHQPHRIIVIDEVDCFSSNEKAFTLLVRHIIKSQNKNTQTSIIGIANSVDLPFRKKHSAIAMRDC